MNENHMTENYMNENCVYFDDQAARALGTIPQGGVVLSPDRRTVSVTQQIQVDLQAEDQPLSALQVFSLSIPVEASPVAKLTGYLTTIRGRVLKTAGARVALLADIGGTAKVLEYSYGETTEIELQDSTASARGNNTVESLPVEPTNQEAEDALPSWETNVPLRWEVFSLETRDPQAENPHEFYTVPPFVLTLALTAQRRTAHEIATLVVDSIDIQIVSS